MQSNKRSMLIAAALLVVLLIAALGYSAWKSREMDRFLAEYLPSTRPGGAGDAVLGAIGVKRYGESTWFERTQAPRWSDIGVHQAAVLSLDNKLSAKLKELGVGAQSVGQARVSAGIDAAEEAKLALLQVADPSALAREIQALASVDPAFASLVAARDSRVITAVGVVVSHKAAQTLSLDLSALPHAQTAVHPPPRAQALHLPRCRRGRCCPHHLPCRPARCCCTGCPGCAGTRTRRWCCCALMPKGLMTVQRGFHPRVPAVRATQARSCHAETRYDPSQRRRCLS